MTHCYNNCYDTVSHSLAISAKQYDVTEQVDSEDLRFPQEEDLVNYDIESTSVTPANVQIPVDLLKERLNQTNETGNYSVEYT